jgi:hypothetical protein
MAKRPKKDSSGKAGSAEAREPLAEALATFARGDYVKAARHLEEKIADPSLPEGAREQAQRLLAATKLDRAFLLTGLAAAGLYLVVVLATSLLQP